MSATRRIESAPRLSQSTYEVPASVFGLDHVSAPPTVVAMFPAQKTLGPGFTLGQEGSLQRWSSRRMLGAATAISLILWGSGGALAWQIASLIG